MNDFVRASTCHDFKWSRGLWRDASHRIVATAALCILCYVFAASLLAHFDDIKGVDVPYFISACVTTVGLGDISPSSQVHRAAMIILLPFGLMIITLCLSALEAHSKATTVRKGQYGIDDEAIKMSVANFRSTRSAKIMADWRSRTETFSALMRRKLAKILLLYVVLVCFGASFFLLSTREQRLQKKRSDEDMTVIDAFFFSTVIATSAGYGHRIVPHTEAAKGFLTLYYFSAVIVGVFVGQLVNITFERNQMIVENQIIRQTTFVHRTALLTNTTGQVSEADYLMFKLLQLQRVDERILHRLQSRFATLDHERSGYLEVGIEVPSAEQVAEMKAEAENAGRPANAEWYHEKWCERRKDIIMNMAAEADKASKEVQKKKKSASSKMLKVEEEQAVPETLKFPDHMGPLHLASVSTDFCRLSKGGGSLELNTSHPELAPLKHALTDFSKKFSHGNSCPVELSPIAIVTLDAASREIASVPREAVTVAFAYPMSLDSSLVDPAADLSSGPCLLPLGGAFVYFDRDHKVVALNCFVGGPPDDDGDEGGEQPQGQRRRRNVVCFEKPLELPEVTLAALGDRLHPVTLQSLIDVGAVAFTWINRGETLTGIAPPLEGAFAYVLKGGRAIYFPVIHNDTGVRLKLSQIHDFSFSRGLWYKVLKEMLYSGAFYLLIYILVGYYAICKVEGWDAPASWYFLATSFTTVGYGDFAPTLQSTRALAIGLLPLGLITIGFAISAGQAYKLSRPALKTAEDPIRAVLKISDPKKKEKALKDLVLDHTDLFAIGEDGQVTRDDLAQMAPALELSPEGSDALFDSLDVKNKGYVEQRKKNIPFFETISGRIAFLCFQVYWPVLVAAAFFKIPAMRAALLSHDREDQSLTWIDSLYFATVTVTTVGFGDITPQTSGGRIFFAVYIVLTCVWVGVVLEKFIYVYVHDYIGEEIVKKVVNSVTYVHKCDIEGIKRISLPQYLLFKLQQLQMVDKKILDLLSARFDELDRDGKMSLTVGMDIPSAEQVSALTEEVEWWNPTSRSVMEAWEVMQGKMFREIERRKKFTELKTLWVDDSHAEPNPFKAPSVDSSDSPSSTGSIFSEVSRTSKGQPRSSHAGSTLRRAQYEEKGMASASVQRSSARLV